MMTEHQQSIINELQNAWLSLREQVVLLCEQENKQPLLFYIDRCIDCHPVFDLLSMKDSLEAIASLPQGALESHHPILEKIKHIKRFIDALLFTLSLQEEHMP